MRLNEHKRHKHGQLPGDLPKGIKIAMLGEGFLPHPLALPNATRKFRRSLAEKSTTRQRQQDRKKIAEGLEEL